MLVSTGLLHGAVRAGVQEPRVVTVEDLFRIADVGSPAVSPGGDEVAYAVTTHDLKGNSSSTRIWIAALDGSASRPMTLAGSDASDPRWSPDGSRLAFLAARGEGARTQVWALERSGGEARPLTEIEQGVSSFAWSPDGTRLVLVIKDRKPEPAAGEPQPPWVIDRLQFKQDYVGYLDRRRDHLYVLDLASGQLRQLTGGDFDDSAPAWSPDGSRIAFVSNRTADPDRNYDSDIWLVQAAADAPDGPPVKVSTSTAADDSPTWSPDGTRLAWLTSTRPEIGGYAMRFVAVAVPGEAPAVISAATDRNTYSLAFDAGGDEILGIFETEGVQHLVAYPVAGGPMRTIWGGERRVGELSPLPGGGAAVTASTFDAPDEIWRVDADGEALQITAHNRALFEQLRLGDVRKERFSGPDGTQLESFYTFPPGFTEGTRYPTVLWIHGGPQGQDDWGWYGLRQLFAANGYLVVQPNYRGSHGYGQEFALGLWQDWGGPEPVDVIAGVDHAIARGWANPDRLGVGGWSYGGITTNGVITTTDRFKAAVAGASGALWVASYGHDEYQRWYVQELGLPWENRELWERISPFNRVQHITTPTLWIGGEEDWNVPIHNAELMYQSMKQLGRETLLVVYPGQHHGGFPPRYESDRYRRFLGWFGKHLLGDDSAWPE